MYKQLDSVRALMPLPLSLPLLLLPAVASGSADVVRRGDKLTYPHHVLLELSSGAGDKFKIVCAGTLVASRF